MTGRAAQEARARLPWFLAYAAVTLAAAWARTLAGWCVVAGTLLLAAALASGWLARRRGRARRGSGEDRRHRGSRAPSLRGLHDAIWPAALAAIGIALAAGAATERRLDDLASRWEEFLVGREAELTGELQRQMELVVERGTRAAVLAAASPPGSEDAAWFDHLSSIRAATGVSALVVFDGNGDLAGWAGEHRGLLPEEIHAGETSIHYVERPLFSYLYFSAPVAERPGWHVVAAVLLQTEPVFPIRGEESFAEVFEARTGVRPHFAAGDSPDAAWRLVHDGTPVVHGSFEPVTQTARREAIAREGQRAATLGSLAALLLLGIGWVRRGPRGPRAGLLPTAGAALVLPTLPLGEVLGLERLYSPALFVLPLPGAVTLGMVLATLLPVAALVAARPWVPTARRAWRGIALGATVVALGFPAGLRFLLSAAAPTLLNEPPYLWGALFPAAALLLTIVAALSFPVARGGGRSGALLAPLAGGALLTVLVSLTLVLGWRQTLELPARAPALWAVPFALFALGIARYRGRGQVAARWFLGGWLAVTAVVPTLWLTSMDSRFRAAERELASLGARVDPYLDYLLRHFATDVRQRAARGASGVELLYRSWIASGMAREGYPATIAVWDADGALLQELSLGGGALLGRRPTPPRWDLLRPEMERARETGQVVVDYSENVPGANHFLVVPLDNGHLVSVVVPPRVSLDWANVLAPFLGTPERTDTRLTLVPSAGESPVLADSVDWRRTEGGWRSEALVRLPDGEYHAHMELRVPATAVLIARAGLLFTAALAGLVLLWLLGRITAGRPPAPFGGWRKAIGGFRARVTVALFMFFLIPTVLFGWIAYRAFAGEIIRAARATAERAVAQAVAAYPGEEQSLAAVAERVGEEVLQFHRGELILASSPEAVALGLYDAWMPASAYLALRSGEQLSAVETRDLVNHPYLLAYRRLAATGVLAVPVSLWSGEIAVRQRELLHVIVFTILLGALLSLTLSVAVGRALTEPIGALQRASAAVGVGRLDVRLPESRTDEFGELFVSFNRMVRQLRRARSQEIRTARVLAWGEMARQVAHEIKNPLTPTKLSVQHLRRAFRDRRPDFGEVLETTVEHILAEIDRLSEVARAFSRYASPAGASGPPEPTSVADVVREVIALYRGGDTAVVYHGLVPDDLPPALARPGELKEVLFNVIENARAASDGGGRITVSATAGATHIDLVVADEGHGIEPELLDRIFEPHFSTRSTGTGLGLAIVRRLVEGWGGAVRVESRVGEGTRLTVRMRRADAVVAAGGAD